MLGTFLVFFAYLLSFGGEPPWNNLRYPLLFSAIFYVVACLSSKTILFRDRIENSLNSPLFPWCVSVLAAIVFARIKILQFYAGEISGVDFSHIDYAIWSTTRGQWMGIPILPHNQSFLNFFGNHFSPILLIPVAVRWIWDSPLSSLVVHGLSLAAAIPIFWKLANQYLSSIYASALILIYVFCGALASTLQFDIHQESFFPLAWGLFFLGIRGKAWHLVLGAILILSVKEDAGIYLFWACLVLAALQKQKRWMLLPLSVLSLVFTYMALKIWMPMHQPEQTGVPYYFTMWANYGSSFQEVIWKMLTHPHWVISDIFSNKALYKNLLPWAFLPFTHLAGIMALAPLAVSSTSSGVQKGFGLYYGIILVPIFFYISCLALEKKKRKIFWVGFGLICSLFVGGGFLKFPKPLEYWGELESAVKKTAGIEGQTVWVQSGMLPFLPYETRWRRIDGLNQLTNPEVVEVVFFEGLEKSTVLESPNELEEFLKRERFQLVDSSERWKRYKR